MEVRHPVHYSGWKTCKNGAMSIILRLIIAAFRNNSIILYKFGRQRSKYLLS
jgi:hypothetical protein